MQYFNQSYETGRASRLIVIYIHFNLHEIRFRGCLVIADYIDFKSIQGL